MIDQILRPLPLRSLGLLPLLRSLGLLPLPGPLRLLPLRLAGHLGLHIQKAAAAGTFYSAIRQNRAAELTIQGHLPPFWIFASFYHICRKLSFLFSRSAGPKF